METRAAGEGFPIIGPHIGCWLYTFSRMVGARRVFELGSGFGYSTWYFAAALRDMNGGMVSHVVWDEGLSADAKGYLDRAGLIRYCDFEVSEAVLALSGKEPGIDIVFMDIDKEGYPDAIPVIEQKLRPGGLLLVDNVLWSGTVADPADERPTTQAIRRMNDMLRDSERWNYGIIPLRDGLGVAWFKG